VPRREHDFPSPERTALGLRAAYVCSNPECRALTVAAGLGEDTVTCTGEAAHITAAESNGSRYEEHMSSTDRKSAAKNGIWLCAHCARLIDKNQGVDFSTEQLHDWKRQHEEWVRTNLNKNPVAIRETVGIRQSGGTADHQDARFSGLDVVIDHLGGHLRTRGLRAGGKNVSDDWSPAEE
jgi:hypothetical protein